MQNKNNSYIRKTIYEKENWPRCEIDEIDIAFNEVKQLPNNFFRISPIHYFCNIGAKKLTALKTYNHFVAAILLALYAFVATPVQLWHHHNDPATKPVAISTGEKKYDSISKAADSASESSCQVCSHKYSTYSDDALIPLESSHLFAGAKDGFYNLSVLTSLSFSLSNKGPPVVS